MVVDTIGHCIPFNLTPKQRVRGLEAINAVVNSSLLQFCPGEIGYTYCPYLTLLFEVSHCPHGLFYGDNFTAPETRGPVNLVDCSFPDVG